MSYLRLLSSIWLIDETIIDLLKNKSRPEAAVLEAPEWVKSERELRARLIREKEEREARSAIEREKRKKEREEQKRRADRYVSPFLSCLARA